MDLALKDKVGCEGCGRPWLQLERIEGRAHEVILTADRRQISMTAINIHDSLFDMLLQFQFRQDTPGQLEFCYVPRQSLADVEVQRIRAGLVRKLGDDVTLTVKAVSSIPRTAAGKYRFLDQRLDKSYFATVK